MRTHVICPRRPVALPASPTGPGVEMTGSLRSLSAKTPVLGRLQRGETPEGRAVPGDPSASLGHRRHARCCSLVTRSSHPPDAARKLRPGKGVGEKVVWRHLDGGPCCGRPVTPERTRAPAGSGMTRLIRSRWHRALPPQAARAAPARRGPAENGSGKEGRAPGPGFWRPGSRLGLPGDKHSGRECAGPRGCPGQGRSAEGMRTRRGTALTTSELKGFALVLRVELLVRVQTLVLCLKAALTFEGRRRVGQGKFSGKKQQ